MLKRVIGVFELCYGSPYEIPISKIIERLNPEDLELAKNEEISHKVDFEMIQDILGFIIAEPDDTTVSMAIVSDWYPDSFKDKPHSIFVGFGWKRGNMELSPG